MVLVKVDLEILVALEGAFYSFDGAHETFDDVLNQR